jgi:hypothetical protein
MTSILDKMRDFKWGMKELMHAYLMEPSEGVGYASVKMRRERFMKALLEEEEVLKIIRDEILNDEVLNQLGLVRVDQLCQELETLQKKSINFSTYNNEASLQAFDINNAVVELEAHAPSVFKTLDKLMEDRRNSHQRTPATVHTVHLRSAIVASICCYSRSRVASNHLQNIIGLYLEGSGVKRRVISTMQSFGLSVSHPTILKAAERLNEAGKESITRLTFTVGPTTDDSEGQTT